MNIYICGQKWFGAAVFTTLYGSGFNIVGVSSPEVDRLRNIAAETNVPWMQSGLLNEDNLPHDTDLIVTAHSHDFIRLPVINKTKFGAIGYHPSLLPLHRGKDAIEWTILHRDKVSGGSVYWLSDVMDGGPIAAQQHVFVHPTDTAKTLWERDLAPLGVHLLTKVCTDIKNNILIKIPQNELLATSEPSIKRVK